ncbi:hypothetical protein NQ317_004102 [Molorchus minor]|uniref:Uncharacterized protein n=1 Tax=Molorchus minor TaxID=1323400 RepID=A0ABQ9IZC7_9CUCU|nr:hypothetical protein NQ317_004102 [Molorchus minor]
MDVLIKWRDSTQNVVVWIRETVEKNEDYDDTSATLPCNDYSWNKVIIVKFQEVYSSTNKYLAKI